MSGDLVNLAQEVSPYVMAAIGAFGGTVLVRANEQAADATIVWGRAILQRIFGVTAEGQEVPEAVAELAADPDNPDLQAMLRVQIGRLLKADPELAEQVRTLLEQAQATAPLSAQIRQEVRQSVIGGDSIQIGQARDVDIQRGR